MSISLVAASIAAAAIHFALGPEHVEELGLLGAGFYAAGLLQLGWAGLAILASWGHSRARLPLGAARVLAPAGIAINVAILGAWLVSRVVGLPAGAEPWTPEAIGMSDAIAALLEIGLVVGILGTWVQGRAGTPTTDDGRPGGVPSLVGAAPLLALILVAAVTAVGAPHAHADDATHDANAPATEQGPHAH